MKAKHNRAHICEPTTIKTKFNIFIGIEYSGMSVSSNNVYFVSVDNAMGFF